jgi:hypothetical protein
VRPKGEGQDGPSLSLSRLSDRSKF